MSGQALVPSKAVPRGEWDGPWQNTFWDPPLQCLKMNEKVRVNIWGSLDEEEKSPEGNPSVCLDDSMCLRPTGLSGTQ